MHGIKRTRQSREHILARKQREQAKLADYLALTSQVLSRKKQNDLSEDALHMTAKLLQINPEFYTIWNYRRNILLRGLFPQRTPENITLLLSGDLDMTMGALKTHPKVYWIWNHRRWCLENIPGGPASAGEEGADDWKQTAWEKDLLVVEQMLNKDPRNFHAWDYRRYILSQIPKPPLPKTELSYTKAKIASNFSNFSAWHQRSKILISLWSDGKLDELKSKENEFKLIRDAMYTDPHDQSVWIYHRWLVGDNSSRKTLEREIGVISDLLAEQPDSKWCLESLVHYKRMLIKSREEGVDAQALIDECHALLFKLIEIDPMRSRRYKDITSQLSNHDV